MSHSGTLKDEVILREHKQVWSLVINVRRFLYPSRYQKLLSQTASSVTHSRKALPNAHFQMSETYLALGLKTGLIRFK